MFLQQLHRREGLAHRNLVEGDQKVNPNQDKFGEDGIPVWAPLNY